MTTRRFNMSNALNNNLPDDPPGGGGVSLGGRGLLPASHGQAVLDPKLGGDVVAGVGIRQAGHVAVGRV